MLRNIFIFLGTFVTGALIALAARATMFNPHRDHPAHPTASRDYAPLVSNSLVPATNTARPSPSPASPSSSAPEASSANAHAQHAAAPAKPAAGKPINTVCAICGMAVDPSVPTIEYQGQTIGFGCRMCPPKFKADPDRYGPIYLKNEAMKR